MDNLWIMIWIMIWIMLFRVLLHVNFPTRQGLLGSMASMLCAEALGNELEEINSCGSK